MTDIDRLETAVQAGWFGPCVCPPPQEDAIWQIIDPECVPHGTPETKAAAIIAALDSYDLDRPVARFAAQWERMKALLTTDLRSRIVERIENVEYDVPVPEHLIETDYRIGYDAGNRDAARIAGETT